jgi:hypothetical protein
MTMISRNAAALCQLSHLYKAIRRRLSPADEEPADEENALRGGEPDGAVAVLHYVTSISDASPTSARGFAR